METNYETFGTQSSKRLGSDSSNNSSSSAREVNIFHSTVRTKDSPFGKLRVPSDLENIEIAFLILATLSILGTVALTIYRLANPIEKSDSTFGTLLLINTAFCLVYVFHGVFGERPYELWAFMAATTLVTLYCIIEYAVTDDRTTVKLVRLIILLVLAPVDLILSFKISMQHYTSRNLIIRTLRSANIKLQNMCVVMLVFQTLLKFDFEIGVSLVVLVFDTGFNHTTAGEIVILVVGSFLEVVWLIVGYLLPRFEDISWVYAFLLLSIPQPIYVTYKIVKTAIDWRKLDKKLNGSLIACACLFLVTRCLVSYFLWIVVKNFGKGLREAVYFPDDKPNNDERPEVEVDRGATSPRGPEGDDYLGENVNYDIH